MDFSEFVLQYMIQIDDLPIHQITLHISELTLPKFVAIQLLGIRGIYLSNDIYIHPGSPD